MALIFVTRKIPTRGIMMLEAAGHEVVVSEKDGVLSRSELLTALATRPYEAIVSLLSDTIDGEVLMAAPSVKIVANYAVGYNNIDVAVLKEKGVVATNTPGVLTDTVAEFTMALILAVAKRIPEADQFIRTGQFDGWAPELLLGSDLKGKTLGIVGAGRIGTAVAQRAAHGFGMKIYYNDVSRSDTLEAVGDVTYAGTLEELLTVSDIVSIHVPLVPETHHLINSERLGLMKPGAILINTARGPIVDEVALVSALTTGTLRGAGLDVFEQEPVLAPALTSLPNVILTPHIASASVETRDAMSGLVADNIIAFFSGATPANLVS